MAEDLRRVIVSGAKVQGVGYRAWTVRNARRLGLKGWVRNLSDRSVEALFSGDTQKVAQMLAACEEGPSGARVTSVHDRPATYDMLAMVLPGETYSQLPDARAALP